MQNPFNGIERYLAGAPWNAGQGAMLGIHSMELKVRSISGVGIVILVNPFNGIESHNSMDYREYIRR